MEEELTTQVADKLLGVFGDFARTVAAELNDMMYFVARMAEKCGMESICELRRYFEYNQIDELPSSKERFGDMVNTKREKEVARGLEFYIDSYIRIMQVGNKHFSTLNWQTPIQITATDFYEVISRMQTAMGNVCEASERYLNTIKEIPFIEILKLLMDECIKAINEYLRVVENQTRHALDKYIVGVDSCLTKAREHNGLLSNIQPCDRVKWVINGEKI